MRRQIERVRDMRGRMESRRINMMLKGSLVGVEVSVASGESQTPYLLQLIELPLLVVSVGG
jgi:hypothetical protein